MHICKITANRCKFITNRYITLLLWILFHSYNFTIYTVNNATEMIGSEFCLKKKPTSLNNLAYVGSSFSPTHFWRSKLITFEIRVIFTWRSISFTNFNAEINKTYSPSLRFNDSAKNKMIQVNNNLNFPLQKFITSQLPVSRQNPWSVVSILLDIFQETLPLFSPAPLSYLMIYIALLSLSTNLSEWQCSLCSAKMRNSLIQNKSMLHFYTRRFLKFSMDTEKERWREWVNEKLHSTPITHSESAIKTSIKWVEYVQSRQ